MKRISYQEQETACEAADELQDGRFAVIHGVLIDMLSCYRGQDENKPADTRQFFVGFYRSDDAYNASCRDEVAAAYNGDRCYGVFEFDDEQHAEAFFLKCIAESFRSSFLMLQDLELVSK